MPFPNTLVSWVSWFYGTFISPILAICKNTDVLGFTLFEWLMSLTVVAMAVHFIQDFFGYERKE